MKKTCVFLSLMALFGCNDDDMEAALKGDTRVFAVDGAKVDTVLVSKYYTLDEAEALIVIPDELPRGDLAGLQNLGVKEEVQCGYIDTTDEICFTLNDSASCLPSEVKMLGVKIYTIDIENIDEAVDFGFYPTITSQLTGAFIDFDIESAPCPLTGNEVI
ncbi:hypothetical protein ABT56_16350 [Photobacterium aquae]|uniref:Lipoprotein n=1 Tax=Photobacterium aquae TaxID=1195763 RepID=A0A0J1JPM8_9GAMM|nr:hypothetical protein [Photobacterium aquae]KLV04177.1 hypothetical protein ABT56_16350 [Photobacterium aquae]